MKNHSLIDIGANLVAYTAVGRHPGLIRLRVLSQFGWIIKSLVNDDRVTGKHRAVFIRMPAHGDHVIEFDIGIIGYIGALMI